MRQETPVPKGAGGSLLLHLRCAFGGLALEVDVVELICDLLHEELLQVDVGTDLTEEEEELELLPVLVGELLEARVAFLKGFLRIDAHLADIAERFRLHGRLELEDLIVDVLQLRITVTVKVLLLQRAEDRLDIVQLQDALIIVDKQQDQHMLATVTLLIRWRQKLVLRIVVDHRLRQHLILRMPLDGREVAVHEAGQLIHVELEVRDVIGGDVPDRLKIFH